jgi:hypothetical protein
VDQRLFSVFADKDFQKEAWDIQLKWLRARRHVPGLVGVQVPMPITPNLVEQGVLKGTNALGLEKNNEGKTIVGKYLLFSANSRHGS